MNTFQPGMTVIYAVDAVDELGPDLFFARGTVCDAGDETTTMVDFGEHGDHVVHDRNLILAGKQRVALNGGALLGTTSDTQDGVRTPTHRTIVIWDDGYVAHVETGSLLASDADRDDHRTLRLIEHRRGFAAHAAAMNTNPDLEALFGENVDRLDHAIDTILDIMTETGQEAVVADAEAVQSGNVEQENAALRKALTAALAEGSHGDDCETSHMARNPKCNCWRAEAVRLIPEAATYEDEPDDDDDDE